VYYTSVDDRIEVKAAEGVPSRRVGGLIRGSHYIVPVGGRCTSLVAAEVETYAVYVWFSAHDGSSRERGSSEEEISDFQRGVFAALRNAEGPTPPEMWMVERLLEDRDEALMEFLIAYGIRLAASSDDIRVAVAALQARVAIPLQLRSSRAAANPELFFAGTRLSRGAPLPRISVDEEVSMGGLAIGVELADDGLVSTHADVQLPVLTSTPTAPHLTTLTTMLSDVPLIVSPGVKAGSGLVREGSASGADHGRDPYVEEVASDIDAAAGADRPAWGTQVHFSYTEEGERLAVAKCTWCRRNPVVLCSPESPLLCSECVAQFNRRSPSPPPVESALTGETIHGGFCERCSAAPLT